MRAARSELYLAMADPLNFIAIEEVSAATHRQVIPMIATEAAVERAVQNLYSNQGTLKAIEDMRRDLAGSGSWTCWTTMRTACCWWWAPPAPERPLPCIP